MLGRPSTAGSSQPARGAHSQFKETLREGLTKRVESVVRTRAGPSFDERMDIAVKGMQAKARVTEAEQKKSLSESIARGRSRPSSAPIRSRAESPNRNLMLLQRKKNMRQQEVEYMGELEVLRDKMEHREPLFQVSEVKAAFADQEKRMRERKKALAQEEHENWQHLRSVELSAAKRPLLIEETGLRGPRKKDKSAAPIEKSVPEECVANSSSVAFGGRDEYESDLRIRDAVSQRWFKKSDWAQQVAQIKNRANDRKKLHEIEYPTRAGDHELARTLMTHKSTPARMPRFS